MPHTVPLDPRTLLTAYSQGLFPMGDKHGSVQWYTADPRGIIPLDGFHIPGTLKALVRKSDAEGGFELRINHDFQAIMRACQDLRKDGTWINDRIVAAYVRLHELGFAHSVETWHIGQLAGGLYGVSLGGAFFGESMFHYRRDASKVALVHLVHRLRTRGFTLLDSQANTPHLKRFGCIDIPASDYLQRLQQAIQLNVSFD
jgi:leucyl/phenylalanyl-tRNA--protein transferase